MASVPIGIIHMATYISQFDWEENKKYHYFPLDLASAETSEVALVAPSIG